MNLKQHAFVTEYLRFGDPVIAYHNAYKCYQSSSRTKESAANRLLKNPEIAAAIYNAQSRIRAEVEQELKAELRKELLSIQRKREILARIAEGDVYIEQNYKGKDCRNCTQLVKPTINQMLKAIDLDSKLAGHYPKRNALGNPDAENLNTKEDKVKDENKNVLGAEAVAGGINNNIATNTQKRNNLQQNTTTETMSPPFREDRKASLHITHAGLRKLLSTPLKEQQDILLE